MSEMMYGQIMAHSEAPTDIGATVTFTDETGMVISGTIGNDGYCKKKLPAFKNYIVTLGSISSDPISLGCGENHFAEVGLTIETWAGIKKIIDAHKASDYITTGDTFTVPLGNGETLVYKANVNTYGLDEVDFIPTYCLESSRGMNTGNTNNGGWNACATRSYLNSTFLALLPSDLQAVISEKTVKAGAGNSDLVIESLDKIWLPTETEIFGVCVNSATGEGNDNRIYPIFTDPSSKIRTYGSNGSVANYWTASAFHTNNSYWCYANTSGSGTQTMAAGNSAAILPCFRIAPSA